MTNINPSLSYRESAVASASPLKLVILLYEQAMEDLRRALASLAAGDIEGRTRGINHALVILGQLQGTLDKERGGSVAENLDRFYEQVRAGLMEAQRRQDPGLLEQQIRDLGAVYGAWCEVEKAMIPAQSQNRADVNSHNTEWSA